MCLLQVAQSKTVEAHGFDQLYLLAEEYGWLRTWLGLRKRSHPESTYVLVTAGKGVAKNLTRYTDYVIFMCEIKTCVVCIAS